MYVYAWSYAEVHKYVARQMHELNVIFDHKCKI